MMWLLASFYGLSKKTNVPMSITEIPMSKHSNIDYKENILKPWVKYIQPKPLTIPFPEESVDKTSRFIQNTERNILLLGYLQNINYFRHYQDYICAMFPLNLNMIHKYDDIDDAYFLQVRRGDYLVPQHAIHNVDLSKYYKECTSRMPSSFVYITTNDKEWCESWSFLDDFRVRYVQENDVDSLSVMANTGRGGISANSSFGWWGLYLNTSRSNLFIPDTWYTKPGIDTNFDYVFDGATVVAVA